MFASEVIYLIVHRAAEEHVDRYRRAMSGEGFVAMLLTICRYSISHQHRSPHVLPLRRVCWFGTRNCIIFVVLQLTSLENQIRVPSRSSACAVEAIDKSDSATADHCMGVSRQPD